MIHEDKVSKIGQFGTPTCSPVSPDSGTTVPENQGIAHFCCQNEVNFYPKSLPRSGIFAIRAEKVIGFDLYYIGLKKHNLNNAWCQKVKNYETQKFQNRHFKPNFR